MTSKPLDHEDGPGTLADYFDLRTTFPSHQRPIGDGAMIQVVSSSHKTVVEGKRQQRSRIFSQGIDGSPSYHYLYQHQNHQIMENTQLEEEAGAAIGKNLGTTHFSVAVRQKGAIQIIPNDQGNRFTPSIVAFTSKERLIGDGAKNQAASSPHNTVVEAKRQPSRRIFSQGIDGSRSCHYGYRPQNHQIMESTQLEEEAGPAIGIDLGTTYSCVAVRQKGVIQIIPNDQGNRITPSIVAFTCNERLIGDGAKNQAASNPNNTVFDAKRLIGRTFSEETVQQDMKLWPFKVEAGQREKPMITVMHKGEKKSFPPEEISSMVLGKMKEIAESHLGCPVRNAVITVPAYFNNSQRQATKDAGKIAGLNVMQIINEPTAAALAYGLNEPGRGPKNVFVFDFGGGTLDVCVLVIERGVITVKAVNGDTHLGGRDIDNIMVDHFAREFLKRNREDMRKSTKAINKLRIACEKAKRVLSIAIDTVIDLDSLYEGIDFSTKITRAKFEDLIADIFDRCMAPVQKCLKDAGLSKEDIHDILLVGGSTRIPKVQTMLREFFDGKALCSSIHADEAVAYGAAIQAAAMDKWSDQKGDDFVLLDVTPLSLGMKVAGDLMVPVITRNTSIPCKEEKIFSTSVDYQRGITFHIYEGERSMVFDNNLLGKFDLVGLEPRPAGEVSVLVTFEIDANGILNVSARDYDTGRVAKITITNDKGRLTGEEIDEMIKAASRFRVEDEERKKIALAKLELEEFLYSLKKVLSNKEIMSKLEESERQTLRSSIDDALEWSATNEKADVHEFRSKKSMVEKIWKAILAKLKLGGLAASLAINFIC